MFTKILRTYAFVLRSEWLSLPGFSLVIHKFPQVKCKALRKHANMKICVFFRFPTAKDLLIRWKQFAEKPDQWQPTRLSAICSNHFALTSFKNIKNKYLKSSAIPTIKTVVVEFNADEQTARELDRIRPRDRENKMSNRKPIFIHSSDLFPEHKIQKKIKIPTEYQKEFPTGGYGSKRIKIPKEYEESEVSQTVEVPQDELFYAQFLQPSNDSSNEEQILKEEVFSYHQEQDYANMEVLTEEGIIEVPEEEYFEEVQMEEMEPLQTEYCRLCAQICEDLESFSENESIQRNIKKCFPAIVIQPCDGLSTDICGTCLGRLEKFSQFSDEVLSIQKQLVEKFLLKEVVIQDDGMKREVRDEQMFALADGSHDNFEA